MALRTVIAFSAACTAVLVLGAVLRSMARWNGRRWPRRSGGIVLVTAVPVGLLAASAVGDRALAVVVGAVLLAGFGLARDAVEVPRWLVPVVLVVVSVGVTAVGGVRFPVGEVPDVDFVWTVLWLVGVTTAIAGSGNADGQLPSLAAASAFGVMALGAFAGQSAAATLAGALLGALVGFLAYNLRPASLFMGHCGGLFVGFMLAAGVLWIRPAPIGRPESLLVCVLLVGVALLDAVIVVVSRLRRGRRVTVRIRDHIAHRLVAGGLRPGRAIALLVVVQLALSMVAVLVGRGVLAPAFGGLLGALLVATLTGIALRARMRDGRARGFSWQVRLVFFGLVGFVVVVSAVAAVAAYSSRSRVLAGRDRANAAIAAAREGNPERAAELFAQAERDFAAAHDRLGSLVNAPSLVVPVVGSNLHAARELSRIGVDLSRAGRAIAENVKSDQLRFVNGRVPLENVAVVAPQLESAARVLGSSKDSLNRIRTGYLVGEMKDGITELRGDLARAARDADRAAATARIAPLVLGDGQARRYLLVVQNPAEIRGTGGLVGNWGILTATDGKIRLEKLERLASLNAAGDPATRKLNAPKDYVERYAKFDPAHTWQNVNVSPDFPTVAAVMADLYGQSLSPPVDGVVSVDPYGLAALLQLTGPVRVPDWPEPITAHNVVDVTLRDAYAAFARTPERADFLGDVARVAIDRATSGDLGNIATLSKTLGKAAHEGHISLWFATPEAERVVHEVGVSGALPSPSGDSLHVSNTNAGANKLDYYLQRNVDYAVTVVPARDRRVATAAATIGVELENTVPASGVPQIAAGPYEGATDLFVYGQNHTFLSVYTPLTLSGATVDGQPADFDAGVELGRNVYSRFVDVFAQRSTKVAMDVTGQVELSDGGWYELTLVRQPSVRLDRVTVKVQVPDGYQILDARGLSVVDGVAQATFDLDRTRTVRVRIGVPAGNLWDRLTSGP